MAETENDERKIPVFTVLKNNSILKNIFILDAAPPEEQEHSQTNQEFEESLWIGRHPDCNIILEHPSISRFHLRIHSKPYSLSLSVTDLSSVHGTWVCEKKIEPNVPVDLNEGDILRLGGSSRIYRLHWVPMSVAYDLEYPFVPPMDLSDPVDEKELESDQSQIRDASKDIESMLSEMKIISSLEESIPSAPLMPTDNDFYVSEGVESDGVSGDGLEQNETSDLQLFDEDNQESNVNDTPGTFSAAGEPQMVSLLESPATSPVRSAQKTALSIWSRRGSCASVQVFTCKSKENRSNVCAEPEVNLTDHDGTEIESISRNLFPCESDEDDIEVSDSGIFYSADEYQRLTPVENLESTPIRSSKKAAPRICCINGIRSGVQIITGEVQESCQSANPENSTHHDDTATESLFTNLFDCKDDKVHKENGTTRVLSAVDQSETVSTSENPDTPVRSAQENSPSIWSRRGKSASVQIVTGRVKENTVGTDFERNSTDYDNTTVDSILEDLCPWNHNDVEEIFTPDKENLTFDNPLIRSLQTIDQDNMKESILKSVSSFSDEDGEEIFTPDKENITPDTLRSKSMKKIRKIQVLGEKNPCRSSPLKDAIGSNLHRENSELTVFNNENQVPKSVPKYIASSAVDEDVNKILTPDEKNIISDTLLFKSYKKMRKLEEIKDNNSLRSSPLKNMGSNLQGDSCVLTAANNENQVPEVDLGQEHMSSTSSIGAKLTLQSIHPKGEEDGVPFQSFLVEPISKTTMKYQGQNDSMRTSSKESISHPLAQPVRNHATRVDNTTRWTMVVDTASLLNKESRQALTLLQGLKRTNLIVPSIVVRELDGIKRRGSFFKRTNEASAALQWIEDCIENAKWWIHVQSYAEEARNIAATPPATPSSCFSVEHSMFSPYGAFLDTISPTSDNNILECALFFRTFMNGRLVLLSNDVTLKIKAMTEGLLCESAEQFRNSLVNPFSDRFLWTESSPIGPTWSCMDDFVLREKYYRRPLKNLTKSGEAVKGLKLILLHNSQYRNLSPISPMA